MLEVKKNDRKKTGLVKFLYAVILIGVLGVEVYLGTLFFSEFGIGNLTLYVVDDTFGKPVAGAEYNLMRRGSDKVVATLTIDSEGKGKANGLMRWFTYELVPVIESEYYEPISLMPLITLDDKETEIRLRYSPKSYVKSFEKISGSSTRPNEVFLDLKPLLYKPQLPNGCEITALTAVLNYYGFNVSKETMSDDFLDKVPFKTSGGRLYGCDPEEAFAGNPRDANGTYVFSRPVEKAGNDYFDFVNSKSRVIDVSGSSRETILSYVEQGVPVVMWVTLNLSPPVYRGGWYLQGTNTFYSSLSNLHCVVIYGFKGSKFYAMDPLSGSVLYDMDTLLNRYEDLGSRAVIVNEVTNENQ